MVTFEIETITDELIMVSVFRAGVCQETFAVDGENANTIVEEKINTIKMKYELVDTMEHYSRNMGSGRLCDDTNPGIPADSYELLAERIMEKYL